MGLDEPQEPTCFQLCPFPFMQEDRCPARRSCLKWSCVTAATSYGPPWSGCFLYQENYLVMQFFFLFKINAAFGKAGSWNQLDDPTHISPACPWSHWKTGCSWPPPRPALGTAMKSLTCRFHLQELGREQDPEVPARSDGQEGCGSTGSGFTCIL